MPRPLFPNPSNSLRVNVLFLLLLCSTTLCQQNSVVRHITCCEFIDVMNNKSEWTNMYSAFVIYMHWRKIKSTVIQHTAKSTRSVIHLGEGSKYTMDKDNSQQFRGDTS
jgi:hypothetical protein